MAFLPATRPPRTPAEHHAHHTARMRESSCIARSEIALPDCSKVSSVSSLTISFGIDGPNIRWIGKRFLEVRWKTLPPYLATMKAD